MKRTDNPELKRKILTHLAEQYQITEVREPNHLSSYVYCRTKGFFDQKQTVGTTDEEVLLFALGYGLQDVLTPKDATTPLYNKDGIIYRPDLSFYRLGVEELGEIKTTRKSAKNHYIDDFIPVTWLTYMKGGCYIRGVSQYDLIVLYMMGNYAPPFPQVYCDTFTFSDDELEENWNMILGNKTVLEASLSTGQPPTPFKNCYDWECKYCRYKLVCETLTMASGPSDKQIEEDKKLWD